MPAHPEWDLQVKVHQWVRECVAVPHVFLAFDRSRAQSRFQHVREKMRGLTAGTPDTVLLVKSIPDIWVELKIKSQKPRPNQIDLGARINLLGRVWTYCDSVDGYRRILLSVGVPLAPSAEFRAMQMDAVLDRPAAEKRLAKRASKQRAPRPTLAQVRRAESARLLP